MAQAQGNFLDNDWHHVAIAVNRNSGRAQFYVDGVLNMYFDAAGLGGIAAASVYLGARGWYMKDNADHVTFDRYFTGVIDGFRLWNTYLDATLINNNSNILLKGDELGLMRSEEHTSELQSLMRISYAVFCFKKKKKNQ